MVQETLLALHLKRHTWDQSKPLLPWAHAVARNKVIDNLRRRGKGTYLPIDDVSEFLVDDHQSTQMNNVDAKEHHQQT